MQRMVRKREGWTRKKNWKKNESEWARVFGVTVTLFQKGDKLWNDKGRNRIEIMVESIGYVSLG